MRRIILIAAIGLLALQAAAGEPWQNGFSVGVEGNFALYDEKETVFNDFKGTTVSGSYTAFLAKGLFVKPQISVYYESHSTEAGYWDGVFPETIDHHASETGMGFAVFAGYRIPAGQLSVDLLTGPCYSIAIDQHETYEYQFTGKPSSTVSHYMDQYNRSSLRWRFGLGLNVWRLTVGAYFDLSMLKIENTPWSQNDRESNVVSVGIGYNF